MFAAFGLLAGLLLGSQEGLSSWLLSATVTIMNFEHDDGEDGHDDGESGHMMKMAVQRGYSSQDDFIDSKWFDI